MEGTVRPRIFVSRCLGFDACRWNGVVIEDDFVSRLASRVDIVHACPEMAIGLGCPRDPVRLVSRPDESRPELFQPATGRRYGDSMLRWSAAFLEDLPVVDGFLLKSRSPSCGWKDVKVYAGFEPGSGSFPGAGLFGRTVLETRPGTPVADEGRLRNFTLRESFLGAVWTLARFREARRRGEAGALVDFHSRHKLYLLLLDQASMRRLGRIVANHDRLPPAELFDGYRETLLHALARPPRFGSLVNVIQHAFGGFSDSLSPAEKKLFADLVEQYRDERIPASVLLVLVRSWAIRFGERYLLDQTLFEPYPLDLVSITDSGKGRPG